MSDLKPALTPEEWQEMLGRGWADSSSRLGNVQRDTVTGDVVCYPSGEGFWMDSPMRHAIAALALHCQPFGFTNADVVNLKRIGNDYVAWANDSDHLERDIEWGFSLLRLAVRIEALLPPESP